MHLNNWICECLNFFKPKKSDQNYVLQVSQYTFTLRVYECWFNVFLCLTLDKYSISDFSKTFMHIATDIEKRFHSCVECIA